MTLSASQHVVLEVCAGMNGGYGPARLDFLRILPDATAQAGAGGLGWRVPAGHGCLWVNIT